MPKISEKFFLDEIGYTPVSKEENELLNENFKFENIDELVKALNNTETEEEYSKVFNRISNRATIFKKLMKTVSDSVGEKKN